ncbi:PREDICTED: protein E6-like [Ipomoea nil]|uniref:protein E6-like n=1 Tax=Ipomoea nil TaxID=35883 RepID=UPI00090135D5|nr:PREDICTED: protein E6-like [Ipomoea nil]
MASIVTHFSIFFLFSLLSPLHLHARESQFFSKIPRNNVVIKAQTTLNPQEQQPNFVQESENGGYGLYGRESTTAAAKNLPSWEENIPNKKYLPKNYSPVSYVTVPEDTSAGAGAGKQKTSMPSDTFMQSGYTNGGENYFNNQKERYPSATTTTGNRNDQYNGGDANGGFKKQGMSDTRFLDGGRYYNNGERFPRNPLDNSRNQFGNSRYFNENNNNFMENSYQNEEEFEDEDDDDLP